MNDTLQAAKLDQILQTKNRQVIIDADSCALISDLKRIDKTLEVRFVDGDEPFFCIYQNIDHEDGRNEQHLVTTAQAYPTSFGTFTGLDQRLVDRVMQITHPSYDFGAEASQHKTEHDAKLKRDREDILGEIGEQAAHAMRKDMGVKTKAFIK